LASKNAEIYAAIFKHVPWSKTNDDTGERSGSSIWPVCPPGKGVKEAVAHRTMMPFHQDFWLPPSSCRESPQGIKGFFTKLPTNWTIGENNHPGNMSVMALTQNQNGKQDRSLLGGVDISDTSGNV
jgi:phospholipase D1/2